MKALKNLAVILVIICATFVCYANALRAPFLWDDEVLILRNHYIRNYKYIPSIFTTSHFQGGGEGGNFYRPLQIISYFFDYSLWRLNPFGFHLTNLILHCLVAVVVYFLVAKISANNLAGFLTAIFFVVHPVHTEAVTYIAGRADLSSSVFLLLAFISFIKISIVPCLRRYLYWFGSCLFYILALFSKESALVFLFLTIFYSLCFIQKREIKSWIAIYITFLFISGIYIFIRVALLAFPKSASLSLIARAPLLVRLLTVPKICLIYFGLLTFPIFLHMERHFLVVTAQNPYFWFGLMLLFLTIWLFRLTHRRFRPAFFYLGWFVITLIPVLNIIPLNATMAEHWLYLPSIGFCGLMAAVAMNFFFKSPERIKKFLLILGCLLFLFYCARTIMRNFQWQDSLELYTHDLRYSPNSFLLHNNLGVELFRKGKIVEAGKEFQTAIKICPDYATSHNNLGVVLENQGKIEEAIAHYQVAIDLNSYILAYGNLGRIYLIKIKQAEKALVILEEGEKLYPQDVEISYYLAVAYFQEKRFLEAKERFVKVSRLAPHYRDTDMYLKELMKL